MEQKLLDEEKSEGKEVSLPPPLIISPPGLIIINVYILFCFPFTSLVLEPPIYFVSNGSADHFKCGRDCQCECKECVPL